MPDKKYTVWCQEWEESEQGWGARPDGFTIHVEYGGADAFLKQMRANEAKTYGAGTPPEYSRPIGKPYETEVNKVTYKKLASHDLLGVKGSMWLEGNARPPKKG